MKRVVTAAILLTLVASMACAEEAQEQKYTVGIDADSVDQIAQTLERYADGPLGVYYEGAVRKNKIVPVVQLAGIFVILACGVALLRCAITIAADKNSSYDAEGPWLVVGTIVVAVTVILWAAWMGEGMPRMISPEYYAIQDILQSLPR